MGRNGLCLFKDRKPLDQAGWSAENGKVESQKGVDSARWRKRVSGSVGFLLAAKETTNDYLTLKDCRQGEDKI